MSQVSGHALHHPGDISIRSANTNDLQAIAAFDPFRGDRSGEVEAGRVLVAETDGRVVGYTTFSRNGFIGRAFVNFLAVSSDHRRRGVASALLRAVEQRIAPGRLFISTEEINTPMLQLLSRGGWTAAGCVQGVNDNGAAECFFYRDLT